MPSKPKKTERTHPGLCLDLLDEEHILLFREVAFLLSRTALLKEPSLRTSWGKPDAVCASCGARTTIEDAKSSTVDAAILDHLPDCVAVQAQRLLASHPVLDGLASLEYGSSPITQSGKSYRKAMDAFLSKARAERTKRAEAASMIGGKQ